MRQHQGRVSRAGVVTFLVFEDRFPRSLRYCIKSALGLMHRLWPEGEPALGTPALARVTALDAWLAQQSRTVPTSIHDLLTHVVDEVSTACEEVQQGLSGETPRATKPPSKAPSVRMRTCRSLVMSNSISRACHAACPTNSCGPAVMRSISGRSDIIPARPRA